MSSAKDYRRYLKNKNLPFFNRCIQALYPPGSTFKIVTFVAALEHLHFDPYKVEDCTGKFELGDRFYVCSSRAGQFEHSLALLFFGIGTKTDLFQSCGHLLSFPNLLAY